MPRQTSKTKPLTVYPSHAVAAKVEEIAAQEHRSVSAQLLIWLEQRPELREVHVAAS